jgi:hypothetical protein
MDVHQTAGAQWRAGADTCVFKPSVACSDGTAPRAVPGTVSRVTADQDDARIQTTLLTNFPGLTQNRMIAVAEKICTPTYDRADLLRDPDFRGRSGCDNLGRLIPGVNPRHVNMISRQLGDDFSGRAAGERWSWSQRLDAMIVPLCTTILLVPDGRPWAINVDSHMENLFEIPPPVAIQPLSLSSGERLVVTPRGPSAYSLGDWGRCFLFGDTSNLATLAAEVVAATRKAYSPPGYRYRLDGYAQHPPKLQVGWGRTVQHAMEGRLGEEDRNFLRGWFTYELIAQVFYSRVEFNLAYIGPPGMENEVARLADELLTSSSQASLLRRLNQLLVGVGKTPLLTQAAPAAAPAAPPPRAAPAAPPPRAAPAAPPPRAAPAAPPPPRAAPAAAPAAAPEVPPPALPRFRPDAQAPVSGVGYRRVGVSAIPPAPPRPAAPAAPPAGRPFNPGAGMPPPPASLPEEYQWPPRRSPPPAPAFTAFRRDVPGFYGDPPRNPPPPPPAPMDVSPVLRPDPPGVVAALAAAEKEMAKRGGVVETYDGTLTLPTGTLSGTYPVVINGYKGDWGTPGYVVWVYDLNNTWRGEFKFKRGGRDSITVDFRNGRPPSPFVGTYTDRTANKGGKRTRRAAHRSRKTTLRRRRSS